MELLNVGKILGAHNLKGEVKVVSNIDNIKNLENNKILIEMENKETMLLTVKKISYFTANKYIFLFEEIKNKKDTIPIRNSIIKVRRDILGFAEDEYFMSDLLGIQVYDVKENEYLGEVTEIFETAAHDVYIVESETHETMIPDVDVFVKKIDYKNKRMEVNIIDGMREEKKGKK